MLTQPRSHQPAASFVDGTAIELIRPEIPYGRIRFALFDFDGTISLIREGWQAVMIPMMVEVLKATGTGESRQTLTDIVTEFVTRLTGKQTIYQMIELAEQVRRRGGTPLDPLEYKHEYLQRLWTRIEHRVAALSAGTANPEDMMVPGARRMLEILQDANVTMYLASGTDIAYVRSEAAALGVDDYFGDRIYGALDDYKNFSKKMIIERILRENDLHGPEFIAFGDGYVEIEDCKAAGGIAVGVASEETRREGIDEWKRERLIQAGADVIIPDFREARQLAKFLRII